ncbi:MAG: succinyl-diaminopimelate desuccinylase [Alphaproteobacteria bacterium]|nr:MAG: succinyl-diaminopimelate desuccinylase [Alphaproteobacteria bacterium]
MSTDPVAIARDLIRCRSVTPADRGALDVLARLLRASGFAVEMPTFSEPGTADVANLYARIGEGEKHLAFAGHTDVVAPGEESAWSHPPFAGEIADRELFGRGAVDMKGAIACFLAAAIDYVGAGTRGPGGSISLLITGDEEGVAINGTVKLLRWAAERGIVTRLGDTLKIGRRGSLNGALTVSGRQGHVASPQLADNPIRGLVALMSALMAQPLDEGTEHFAASNLEFTSVDVGNRTVNLIPGEARARFNIRFNDRHTQETLKHLIETRCREAAGEKVRWRLEFELSNSDVFLTKPGPFVDLVAGAVAEITGHEPARSTAGGTSDARFIKDYCPVVELGLIGRTAHQIDERVSTADLEALTAIYRRILEKYFG